MKLRISGNSIRLRLSQAEVQSLIRDGKVLSECNFGNNILQYTLVIADNKKLSAGFSNGIISVYIPESLAAGWETDERIGFDVHTEDGLYILIEKDFQCLKPRIHEDESGLFPNPQAFHGTND